MSFIQDFIDRGYFYQCTDKEQLNSLMKNKKIAAYIGFDATADSLHVGSLIQIMILRLLQQHGHQPIIIIGGATTKIGDPTGKDESRRIISFDEMALNIAGIKKSLSKFLKFDTGTSNDALILNNNDWFENFNYIDFLQDCGRHISVNKMLSMDSVKSRLSRQQHMSFLEMNYMLLQAYDFYHLNKYYNCVLQIGGSEQWGNILMGTELIQKKSATQGYGLTTQLVTMSNGQKMGKSVNGAVWLNEDKLSEYEYFQFWRNCSDSDILKFAKLFGEYKQQDLEELNDLIQTNVNKAKKKLAHRLTELCHGEVAANHALETAVNLFEKGLFDDNMPNYNLNLNCITQGIALSKLLFDTKICSSKSEAKRLIRGGGVKANDKKIENENLIIDLSYFENNKQLKITYGKKNNILIRQIDE